MREGMGLVGEGVKRTRPCQQISRYSKSYCTFKLGRFNTNHNLLVTVWHKNNPISRTHQDGLFCDLYQAHWNLLVYFAAPSICF